VCYELATCSLWCSMGFCLPAFADRTTAPQKEGFLACVAALLHRVSHGGWFARCRAAVATVACDSSSLFDNKRLYVCCCHMLPCCTGCLMGACSLATSLSTSASLTAASATCAPYRQYCPTPTLAAAALAPHTVTSSSSVAQTHTQVSATVQNL
jgi:hypothetical protein